jgi:hypothetical protein
MNEKPTGRIYDDKMSIRNAFSRIEHRNAPGIGDWLDGDVVTPLGIASVYTQGGNDSHYYTRIDVAHKGKLHIRNIGRRFTQRGLVRMARKFIEEIVK